MAMGLFDKLFSTKRGGAEPAETPRPAGRGFGGLAEMAAILTGGSPEAAAEMSLLAGDGGAFITAHPAWCGVMFGDMYEGGDAQGFTLNTFAYWLTGYEAGEDEEDQPPQFGAYIDWKEMTEDIVWNLSNADKNLGYALDFEKMAFTGDESTDEALSLISASLSQRGFTLTSLDTDSDCYHLFVIPKKDWERLQCLAGDAGFKFIKF